MISAVVKSKPEKKGLDSSFTCFLQHAMKDTAKKQVVCGLRLRCIVVVKFFKMAAKGRENE